MFTDLQSAPAASPRARVLVVEDEGLIARDLGSRLKKAGYEVAGVVDSGEAALEHVSASAPDLVLMDIRLRGKMDGIEAARLVQERVDVPVIYLTAHTDRDTLERAKVTGPFGYLTKPIGQATLPVSIELALYRHKTERESRQQKAWLATVLSNIADAVVVTDASGAIRFMNPKAETLTGWTFTEVQDHALPEVLRLINAASGKPVGGLLDDIESIEIPRPFPSGVQLVTRFGATLAVEGDIAVSRTSAGLEGSVLTFRDVTRRQAEEQELRQQQKMQAIGRISAGVAHDFNNLLTVILGHTEQIRSDESSSGSVRESAQQIEEAAITASAVTRQLLTFSRKQSVRPQVLDLNAVIRTNEPLCRRLAGPQVQWSTRLDPGLMPLYADPGQLAQVLLNLVTNARDAMPEGGQLDVETSNLFVEAPRANGLLAQRYVVLTVRDNGAGMDASVAERLFEPFFTTKEAGQGTGLGLAIVYSIVTELGGSIEVQSRPGEGSTFTVYLPNSAAANGARPSSAQSIEGSIGMKTILVVEDNPAVRAVICNCFVEESHYLLQASNAEEAMVLSQEHPGLIDLLITDMLMPGTDGYTLANELLRRRPELQVLFISGYAGELLRKLDESKSHFLPKPFRREELLQAVRETLGDSSGATVH